MKILATLLGIIGLVLGIYAFCTWLFQTVWNWVAVGVFNAPVITFWQALGIIFLLSFIGSFVRVNTTK